VAGDVPGQGDLPRLKSGGLHSQGRSSGFGPLPKGLQIRYFCLYKYARGWVRVGVFREERPFLLPPLRVPKKAERGAAIPYQPRRQKT
jgi:hypothetical protein